jgi:hypothetical protein
MEKEDRELLIKDLCTRVPYRTRVCLYGKETCTLTGIHGDEVYVNFHLESFYVVSVKPYLRPMSSMTEDERSQYNIYIGHTERYKQSVCLDSDSQVNPNIGGYPCVFLTLVPRYINWLLEHHFDYNGLIEKGLALAAPKGMYNY